MLNIQYTPDYLELNQSGLDYKNENTGFSFKIEHCDKHIYLTFLNNYANYNDLVVLFKQAEIITDALRRKHYKGYFHSIIDVSNLTGLSPEARKLLFQNFKSLTDYESFAIIGASIYIRTILNLHKKLYNTNVFFVKSKFEALDVIKKQIEHRLKQNNDNPVEKMVTKPEWSAVSKTSTYRVKIGLLDEDIIIVEPAGYAKSEDIDLLSELFEKVLKDTNLTHKKYYRIQDYSKMDGASKEARKKFSNWLSQNISFMHFTVFYDFNPVMKTIFNFGRILYKDSDKIITANTLRDALDIIIRHKSGVYHERKQELLKSTIEFNLPESKDELENLIYMLLDENKSLRYSIVENTNKLYEIVGKLSWDYNEKIQTQDVPDNHFSGLYDAISIIKQDVYNLLQDRELHIEDLREKEHKYYTLFESANDAIFIIRDNIIIECNKKAEEVFQYTKDAIINNHISKFSVVENQPENFKNYHLKMGDIIKNGAVSNIFEWKMQKADGSIFDADISINSFDIKHKPHYQVIIRDVSKRKAYEKELEEHRNRLEDLVEKRTEDLKNAKLKAEESDQLKTYFLANMSHEIRTPMNVIIGFADLLMDEDLPAKKRMEYIRMINNSSNALLRLINDIIDMAKIEANQLIIEKENVSIQQLIRELRYQFNEERHKYDKGKLKIEAHHPEKDIFVYTDVYRLRQIFINLLNNALKFTNEGVILYGYEERVNDILFFVKDTGIGMDKKVADIVFNRFRQADESASREYDGTGLGLSITKSLVEILGGSIWVNSVKNKGSEFYFTLPKADNGLLVKDINKNTISHTIPDWKNKTLLIVEDEETNFRYLKEMLLSTQINILRAFNGNEAVKYVSGNPDIDLILMDIQLPEMNGYEATKKIKTIKPEIPVIAQTAFAMADERDKCFVSGCNEYIAKPLRKNILLNILKNYL